MNKKAAFIFLFFAIGCFFYLSSKSTYTSYESNITGKVNANTAGIHLSINGFDVMNSGEVLDNRIILENTTWESTHTREKKISPGSSGTIDLEVDPSSSDVAILYEFRFVDKVIDEEKLLNFGTIVSDDTSFVKTGVDTYTGLFTLDDINNGKKANIHVDFYFDYLNDIEGITEDNQVFDDLFEIHFHAIQYKGEEIVPYSGG